MTARLVVLPAAALAAALSLRAGEAVPPAPRAGAGEQASAAEEKALRETPVARVNGEVLTRADLDDALLRIFGEAPIIGLVRERILEAALTKEGVAADEKEAQEFIEKMRKGFSQFLLTGLSWEEILGPLHRDEAGLRRAALLWVRLEKLARKARSLPVSAPVSGKGLEPYATFLTAFELPGASHFPLREASPAQETFQSILERSPVRWDRTAAAMPVIGDRPMKYADFTRALWDYAGPDRLRAELDRYVGLVLLEKRKEEAGVEVEEKDALEYVESHWEEMVARDPRLQFVPPEQKPQAKAFLGRKILLDPDWLMDKTLEKLVLLEIKDGVLQAFFEKNKDRYGTAAAKARHIFVATADLQTRKPLSDSADQDARDRLDSIEEELSAGKAFGDLSRDHSDDEATREGGGDLGTFGPTGPPDHPSAREEAFLKKVFEMKAGERARIRTPLGYHLVEVSERSDGAAGNFEKSLEAVRRDYIEARTKEYLAELRAGAKIEILLPGAAPPPVPPNSPNSNSPGR